MFRAIVLVLCLTASSEVFAAPGCAELPPSDLKLHPLSVDYIDQEIATPEEIARLSNAKNARPPHPLMAVRYAIDSNVGLVHRLVPADDGGFCDSPETVVFGFGITRRRVLLTPEAASEPCVKSALLAHEAENYRVVGEAIRGFLHQQEAALARQLRELKAQRGAGEISAKGAMETGLLDASARLLELFNKNEAGRIREQIDSPVRLSALGASCNGRIADLERRLFNAERPL